MFSLTDISDVEDKLRKYICNEEHIITPVFPEGLGRDVPMYTHSSPVCFGPM